MPVEVARQLGERYGLKILEGYGLSESAAVVSIDHLDFPAIAGSVGQPIAGVLVRIVDKAGCPVPKGQDGEIVVRGHYVMKGYYKNALATAESIRNGWFHTGDIGRFDERGYLYVVDRLKDMIIRGGFNVYPRELEEVLMTHEAVAQAAVVGVVHDTHGEEVKAFIVLKADKSVLPEDLIAWSKQRMAAYKYPRLVEIVTSLPLTASGKVLKRAL
jgi:long-chain acyl-CoA synthetase